MEAAIFPKLCLLYRTRSMIHESVCTTYVCIFLVLMGVDFSLRVNNLLSVLCGRIVKKCCTMPAEFEHHFTDTI